MKLALEVGFPAGDASKTYGICNFLETGAFGRVGRAGLAAIQARQYESDNKITQPIWSAFALFADIGTTAQA